MCAPGFAPPDDATGTKGGAVSADGSQTLERGLTALRLIAGRPEGLTAGEVAVGLGVHRSIAYRLLAALVRQGFARKDGTGRHRLGAAFFTLAELARPPLLDAARPVLGDLAAELGVTACLVVAEAGQAVAVAVVEPPGDGPRLSYRLGSRDPLERGAGGLALLAAMPAAEGEPDRVAEVRARGYARTGEELIPGVHGVAAPVGRAIGEEPAAVTVLAHRPDLAERAVPAVLAAASRLGRTLGPSPASAEGLAAGSGSG
jgi:DNA-binding IclR family transcriptional regulator